MIKMLLISLGLGFIIGYRRLIGEKWILLNGKLQTLWLVILIFVMGVGIGGNKEVLHQLPALGGKAILFAIISSAGSVAVIYFISKMFFRGEEKER